MTQRTKSVLQANLERFFADNQSSNLSMGQLVEHMRDFTDSFVHNDNAGGITVSGPNKLLGRVSSGSGGSEEIDCTAAGRALLDDADAAAQRTTLSAAARSQTFSATAPYSGTVSNGDLRLVLKAGFAGTITETTTICASGTATATFKINTTALGGTANSVSSSEQSQSHTTNNAFVAGDDIIVTISSASSLTSPVFAFNYTMTLA